MPSREQTPDDVFPTSEAIVVVDMIESTATSDRFGWYAVGRQLMWELRRLITDIGKGLGLRCIKSTGDGYLLAYGDAHAAEIGAVNALMASFELLYRLVVRNAVPNLAEEQAIYVRCAIHFGEVDALGFGQNDVFTGDREGPNVSFTFRIEAIRSTDLAEAMNPMPAEQFPLKNYIFCSERVTEIIERRCPGTFTFHQVGLFKLKGFSDWRGVYHAVQTGK